MKLSCFSFDFFLKVNSSWRMTLHYIVNRGKYFTSKSSWFPLDLKVLPYFLAKKGPKQGIFGKIFMEITPITDFGNVLKFLTSPTKIGMEVSIKYPFSLIRESFFYILWLRANKHGSPTCQFLKLVPRGFRAQKRKYFPLS